VAIRYSNVIKFNVAAACNIYSTAVGCGTVVYGNVSKGDLITAGVANVDCTAVAFCAAVFNGRIAYVALGAGTKIYAAAAF